ncbi:MAG: hypothetical protein M4D80_24005 [Myxococcota bacterium]|nr:hypothetical protein [Myxococcota bacterium]
MTRVLLVLNALAVVVFAALHFAGARVYAGFLSGNVASGGELLVGITYVLAYFAVVLWVPITTLAVILDVACGRLVLWRASRRH